MPGSAFGQPIEHEANTPRGHANRSVRWAMSQLESIVVGCNRMAVGEDHAVHIRMALLRLFGDKDPFIGAL
jgi:hypothetical protein